MSTGSLPPQANRYLYLQVREIGEENSSPMYAALQKEKQKTEQRVGWEGLLAQCSLWDEYGFHLAIQPQTRREQYYNLTQNC